MNRLTIKDKIFGYQLKANIRVSGDCDTYNTALNKLAEYEDLEEQGRLIKLPCKVGEEVWNIENIWDEETPISMEFDYWMIPFWGETCFLTYEEAVAKLKEAKGE